MPLDFGRGGKEVAAEVVGPDRLGGTWCCLRGRACIPGFARRSEPTSRKYASCTSAVACSVCPGFSWASLAAASFRSSSYTSGSSCSAAAGSPDSIRDRMRVTSDMAQLWHPPKWPAINSVVADKLLDTMVISLARNQANTSVNGFVVQLGS